MTIAFVQLVEAWGDEQDSLGYHADFRTAVRSYAKVAGVGAIIVEPSATRAEEERRAWPDGSGVDIRVWADVNWQELGCDEVVVACASAARGDILSLDRAVREAGFLRSGRAWGAAGDTRRYVRPRSASAALQCLCAETKVQAGAAIVHMRDHWFDRSRRDALRMRIRVATSRQLSAVDVLDDRLGRPLPDVRTVDVRSLLPRDSGSEGPEWNVSLTSEADPMDTAQACFDAHGVWPISFSYPNTPLDILDRPRSLIAPIVPGYPYSFDDVWTYLQTYQSAYLGVTHRKAGWDCFRHVEIMAAGAIPLMPDAVDIPAYSMVHYPKHAFANVVKEVRRLGSAPTHATREAFRRHFERHLTSIAMAQYLLSVSRLEHAQRVLFVDERLPRLADYQSVLTLIGLKQLLGPDCHVRYPVDYIYDDTSLDTSTLYGRGFGYSRIVPGNTRSVSEQGGKEELADFDAVVVGSIARNTQAAHDLLRRFPSDRTIWIHGEDTPPLPDVVHDMRSSGAHVFVRAIHTGR